MRIAQDAIANSMGAGSSTLCADFQMAQHLNVPSAGENLLRTVSWNRLTSFAAKHRKLFIIPNTVVNTVKLRFTVLFGEGKSPR